MTQPCKAAVSNGPIGDKIFSTPCHATYLSSHVYIHLSIYSWLCICLSVPTPHPPHSLTSDMLFQAGAAGGILLQQRGGGPPTRGQHLAQGGQQEVLEEVLLCPPHLRPLLRAQGQEDVQGLGLPRNV